MEYYKVTIYYGKGYREGVQSNRGEPILNALLYSKSEKKVFFLSSKGHIVFLIYCYCF